MMRKTDKAYINARPSVRSGLIIMAVLVLLSAVCFIRSASVYAAKQKEDISGEKPIREVHQVKVGDTKYCFFVTHNVVLVPEDIAEMSDDELTAEILQQSGLFMKQTNCKKPSHGIITVKQLSRRDKEIFLSDEDLNAVRMAEPEDGEPVKLHMDLLISDGPREDKKDKDSGADKEKDADKDKDADGSEEDSGQDDEGDEGEEEEEQEQKQKLPDNVYSTFRRTSPGILFMAVATPEDAAYGEAICVEDKKKPDKDKKKGLPDIPDEGGEKEEMLPEFRTISLIDRSGGPLEATLKDGDPVDLEWIEPAKHQEDGRSSLIDRIPGGMAGLAIIVVLILAAFAAAVYAAVRHKRSRETEV